MSSKTILIVDDEPTNISIVASILQDLYQIKVATDGETALKIVEKETPDFILLDIVMPTINGYDVANRLKSAKKSANIPFIFLTAKNDPSSIVKGFRHGAVDYISKPFSKEELLARVSTHLKVNYLQKSLSNKVSELETIFETTKDGIAILDLNTNFLFFNNAYLEMTKFSKEELLKKSCTKLTVEKDLKRSKIAINEVIEKGFIRNFEKTCITKEGKRIKVNLSITLMPDKERLLVSMRDITDIKNKERLLNEYLKLIDQNIITSSTDLDGNITYVSDAFCKISGYTKKELIGQKHNIVRHPEVPQKIYKDLWNSILDDGTWLGEICNKNKNNEDYWIESTITPIYDESNEKVGYTAINHDITDKKNIELISITDGLTNIYNRRYFDDIFPKIIENSKHSNDVLCFLILDIDFFKLYNDTYGHQMGDEVLIKVAATIKNSLKRDDDYCFRLGGEEFGILYKSTCRDNALKFANILRHNIENLQIKHSKNNASKYITASMGLISNNAGIMQTKDEIFKLADELLYRAKEHGRNMVCTNN